MEMQVVKNGSVPFNQAKNNKQGERENTSINYE